jgi:HPt (histidine-containing phosphotransfer) domain-containing protein
MDDYISKPLDRTALAAMLRRWLPAGEPAPLHTEAPRAPEPSPPAPAPARKTPPPRMTALDAGIVGDLLDTMGGEFGDLVRVYLEDAPQRVSELVVAAETGDAAAQVSAAHTLKSSSANIGATELSELARRIEHAARAGIATGPAELAAGLRAEYERVAEELSRLIDKR